jgi:TatD DNase family protein
MIDVFNSFDSCEEDLRSSESNTITKTLRFSSVFDTHAHLSMIENRGVPIIPKITELFASGMAGIIDIGTEADDLAKRFAQYSSFEKIWFSAGIWPSQEAIENRFEVMKQLTLSLEKVSSDKLVAIGECGFDRHWNNAASGVNFADEAELFSLQLELAEKMNLPVIVHSRDAPDETISVLKQYPKVQSIIHCYSYGATEAEQFLALGAYLSFSGTLTYKNAKNIQEALLMCPRDKMLFETDSPYLAPIPFRGKIAEPRMTATTYQFAAEKLEIDLEDLKKQVLENINRVFGVDTEYSA